MRKNRIESIDFLRGLVMIIMALDHVRDYFYFSGTSLSLSDPAIDGGIILRDGSRILRPGFCILSRNVGRVNAGTQIT